MSRSLFAVLVVFALASTADRSWAQTVKIVEWGLENTWSYYEEQGGRPDFAQDGSPKANAPRYRKFAFAERSAEVREPWLACIDEVMRLWEKFPLKTPTSAGSAAADSGRDAFRKYVASEDPKCSGQFKKTAPRLYFDFTTDTPAEFVLESVEVTTVSFSQYKGGGFAEKEAWYDILLSHQEGEKVYFPEPKLVFKEHGRLTLRLWSDNFHPNMGWIAPMGEYTIDIRFSFSTAHQTVTVSTGRFKIEV